MTRAELYADLTTAVRAVLDVRAGCQDDDIIRNIDPELSALREAFTALQEAANGIR